MTINTSEKFQININPTDENEEIKQNLVVLLSIFKGTSPLARSLGLERARLDDITAASKVLLTRDIYELIEKYEKRVIVNSIDFLADISGKISIVLDVEKSREANL